MKDENEFKMYNEICKARFEKLERKIDSIIWKVIGFYSPFILGIIFLLMRDGI